MKWHTYLMIILTVLYVVWKIYVYSLSIEFMCTKKLSPIKQKYNEIKFILKRYWEWYGLRHLIKLVIAWLIYGGVFLW